MVCVLKTCLSALPNIVQHIKAAPLSPLSGERNPASGFGGNTLNSLANYLLLPCLCIQLRDEIIEAECRWGEEAQPHCHYLT
jgi:hypothetical protein